MELYIAMVKARRMVPAYTNCDMQLQHVAPDDGLKSPKHVQRLMINKDTSYEFVHLVGLLTYTPVNRITARGTGTY